MRTFLFIHKNSSATLTLSANNEDEAYDELTDLVKDTYPWRLEDSDEEE